MAEFVFQSNMLPVIIFVCLFFIALGYIAYISYKKHLLCTFQNEKIDYFRSKILQLLLDEGYSVEEKKGMLHIQKNYFTCVDLHFKQNAAQLEVYWVSSTTTLAWALIILGWITIGILTIIVALLSDFFSRDFAKDTIYQLLKKMSN